MTDTITVQGPNGETREVTKQDAILALAALQFANQRGPDELNEKAHALVLEAVEVYAEALQIGQVALFLHEHGAPPEVTEAITLNGLALMDRFDALKERFDTEFPEYAAEAEDDTEEE